MSILCPGYPYTHRFTLYSTLYATSGLSPLSIHYFTIRYEAPQSGKINTVVEKKKKSHFTTLQAKRGGNFSK